LVIGHWSLVIGYWLLVIGYWSLVIGHWLLVSWQLAVGKTWANELGRPEGAKTHQPGAERSAAPGNGVSPS